MNFTLTNVLQRLYRELGVSEMGVATSGDATSVIDTHLKGKFSGNPFKDGVLFIVRTTDGLAPQGEFSAIDTYDGSAQDFTLRNSLSAAVEAGDVYLFADGTYPYLVMVEIVNDALQALGMIDLVDDTTLVTATETTEYAASAAWRRARPTKIEYYTNPSDANDRRPRELFGWDWRPAAAGASGLIVFPNQPPVDSSTDTPISVWYRDLHPTLTEYDDIVREEIPPELLVAKTAEKALDYQVKLNSGQDDYLISALVDSRREFDRASMRHPQRNAAPHAKTIDPKFTRYNS